MSDFYIHQALVAKILSNAHTALRGIESEEIPFELGTATVDRPAFDRAIEALAAIDEFAREHGLTLTEFRAGAPFKEGDLVVVKGNSHLGRHRVDTCEWFVPRPGAAEPYWLCECTEIRDPIDWAKIPPGTTGIVVGSSWRGAAMHLEHVACECCGATLLAPDCCPPCDQARAAGERLVAERGMPEGLTR